jgi:DnaJ homolog subfamily C member 9
MNVIFEHIMCSDPIDDEERFREIIDGAIKEGKVTAYDTYTKESAKSRKARKKQAEKDSKEAREYAKQLGVEDKIFGNKKTGEKGGMDGLAALIQQRQKARAGNFLADLEAKYGGGKKRDSEEPPEELFKRASKAKSSKKSKRSA